MRKKYIVRLTDEERRICDDKIALQGQLRRLWLGTSACLCILSVLAAEGLAQVPSVREQSHQARPLVAPAAGRSGSGAESTGGLHTTVWRGREVTYEVIDGWAVHDGDILLGRVEEIKARTAVEILDREVVPGLGPRSAASIQDDLLWPGGIIPYEIIEDATELEREEIRLAMAEWNARTPITFVPRNGEELYAKLVRGGCSSVLGAGRPAVVKTVGCGVRVTVHELGHAVGLIHEHQRPDRDEYLMAQPSKYWDPWFSLPSLQFSLFSLQEGPYDPSSLMHYTSGLFGVSASSIPPGIPAGARGSYDGWLSEGDVDGVNRIYGRVPEATVISTTPPGLEVVVDGIRVTTPATFHWPAGSRHVLEAPLWQVTDSDWPFGNRGSIMGVYLFGRWSDGGSRLHEFTARQEETWVQADFLSGGSYYPQYFQSGRWVLSRVHPAGGGWVYDLQDTFEGFDSSPRALSFVSAPDSELPAGIIRLTHRGDGQGRYQIDSPRPWLVTEPTAVELAPGESVDIEVRAL